jgi:hypothetical protein
MNDTLNKDQLWTITSHTSHQNATHHIRRQARQDKSGQGKTRQGSHLQKLLLHTLTSTDSSRSSSLLAPSWLKVIFTSLSTPSSTSICFTINHCTEKNIVNNKTICFTQEEHLKET